MRKRIFFLFAIVSASCFLVSCGGGGSSTFTYPSGGGSGSGSGSGSGTTTSYPTGLTVTQFTENFSDGTKCVGWVAIADTKTNAKLHFAAYQPSAASTPTGIFVQFKSSGAGTPYVVTNGGYFYNGASLSLLIHEGIVKSIAAQADYNCTDQKGKSVVTYPVRGAFGLTYSGSFEAQWVYCVADQANKPYAFPSTMGNDEQTKTYLSSPVTSKSAGAAQWSPAEAIGGGPVLVKNSLNVAVASYWGELLDAGGTAGLSRQPRTAIGATSDGKVIVIVCDGRNQNGSIGFTLNELAAKFISLGAVCAVNLDGGGSSEIVGKDGKVLNSPSDGTERSVPTSVVLYEK